MTNRTIANAMTATVPQEDGLMHTIDTSHARLPMLFTSSRPLGTPRGYRGSAASHCFPESLPDPTENHSHNTCAPRLPQTYYCSGPLSSSRRQDKPAPPSPG